MQAILEALDPAGQRSGVQASAPPEVTEIWIWYPDCLCRARRLALGGDVLGYRVDLDDRRFGDDRSLVYRMRLLPSQALDDAWVAVLAAVERAPVSCALTLSR